MPQEPSTFVEDVIAGKKFGTEPKPIYGPAQNWPTLTIKIPPELDRVIKLVETIIKSKRSVIGRAIIKRWVDESFGNQDFEKLATTYFLLDDHAQWEIKRRMKGAVFGERE